MQAVATRVVRELKTLSPREHPMYFHLLRVHLRVCQWKYLNRYCLKPEEWEWSFIDKVLKPIKTDMQPAAESRLKFELTSKNVCLKNICSCRKHGLTCMVVCGKGRIESCGNCVDSTEEGYDADIFERNLFDLFD